MPHARHFTPDDVDYPSRLRELTPPPAEVTVVGPLGSARTVAIVGTRRPLPEAARFARDLAGAVVQRGGVVVSGGAVGIDAAAHAGAVAAGGRTWVVVGTGDGVVYPPENAPLFERVIAGGGAIVSPFAPGTPAHRGRFLRRNAVLVVLSDILVIVQARLPSGSLNAALWARRYQRPRWVVCPLPWNADDPDFAGCQLELHEGARPLTSIHDFLAAIDLPQGPPPLTLTRPRNRAESRVLASLGRTPKHVDAIVLQCGLPYSEVVTLLLTLGLEDVLVEGPEGFYRRLEPP